MKPETKPKFKVGDKVRIKRDCSGTHAREVCTVYNGNKEGALKEHLFAWNKETREDGGCSCEYNWELISKSPEIEKPKKVNFLLKYDLDQDPIEEFETLPDVRKRISELLDRDDLKRDSIVIYEVKAKKSVQIQNKIVIK